MGPELPEDGAPFKDRIAVRSHWVVDCPEIPGFMTSGTQPSRLAASGEGGVNGNLGQAWGRP